MIRPTAWRFTECAYDEKGQSPDLGTRVQHNVWFAKWKMLWDQWTGDRDAELKIRRTLEEQGFKASSAKISRYRLVAVQRPGWRQLFSFDVAVNQGDFASPQYATHYGLLLHDERYNLERVKLFDTEAARQTTFLEWSDEMHRLK